MDYTQHDPTRQARGLDVVLDNVGNHPPGAWRRTLGEHGTYVASFGRKEALRIGPMGRIVTMKLLGAFVSQRMMILPTAWGPERLATVTAWIESGRLRPVLDRAYQLAAAAEGLEYLGHGHARGKVAVLI